MGWGVQGRLHRPGGSSQKQRSIYTQGCVTHGHCAVSTAICMKNASEDCRHLIGFNGSWMRALAPHRGSSSETEPTEQHNSVVAVSQTRRSMIVVIQKNMIALIQSTVTAGRSCLIENFSTGGKNDDFSKVSSSAETLLL